MRQDQVEAFRPFCSNIVNKMLAAIFGELGITSVEDMVPNSDKFITGMIESMYGEDFTEQEIDEIIAFNLKYKDKVDSANVRSEEFINKFFTENQEEIEEMIIKSQVSRRVNGGFKTM